MSKIIEKWWALISLVLLVALYIWGVKNMYFHQDDLDWFLMANRPFWSVMAAPLSDHINYLFRVLLKFEWDNFHLFFPAYLLVSTIMHAIVIYLIYVVAKATSSREDLAAMAALIFTINTNWTEIVLWTSGQTISITAIFVLLALRAVWQRKNRSVYIGLSSLASALALGLLPSTLLVYGIDYKNKKFLKVGVVVLLVSIMVLLLYKFVATDGTVIEYSWGWVGRVIGVMGLATINTVIGRLFLPFDKFEMVRIVLVCIGIVVSVWSLRKSLKTLLNDTWSVFLILQLFFYYLIVAVGRAQFGVGIMRVERYGYLGLMLLLLLIVRIARKVNFDKWLWIVYVIVVVQSVGLHTRAQDYVVRPKQLKYVVEQVQQSVDGINPSEYLPYEILNDQRLRYRDLIDLIGH